MNFLGKRLLPICLKSINSSILGSRTYAKKIKVTMGDPVEHATGIEKRELLAQIANVPDPWMWDLITKGPSTRAEPTEIPSAFDSRLVGCYCHEHGLFINYMWLHKGCPKRCECGYWFVLVHRAPL